MNSIISVNYKFMDVSPKRLVELINSYKYTKGIELYVDVNKENELKYLDDLVYELKRNNLILQIHGEVKLDIDKQIEFLKKIEEYSSYLKQQIVVTFHSVYDEDKKISINKTIDYLTNIIKVINNNKILICLENLNCLNGLDRLNKEDIKTTILNDEKIYFTYDVGHEISGFNNITNLDKYMFEDIRNIHIHSIDDTRLDHMPIYENDKHWNNIIKALVFLKVNKYNYNIVFEYGLDYCYGNTIEDKINDYLKSIDEVSKRCSE